MTTFEMSQIVGRQVSYADFDQKAGLVSVIGNYYHYALSDGAVIRPEEKYQVSAVAGNVLTITPL
ncbi:hypothetical protein [Fructobacillus ficulneus]|uniref:Uncharacterized protein n=1 Tax=Fructobacillus ficulneus TaxID=157463 RepID=A0A0K8MIT1_9LACO|nr:hypothetical protein [Fructobacillus ficulneus]GAP00452.1 hypothetical protein FFIC_284690 [Fructobacillus ficulneus]